MPPRLSSDVAALLDRLPAGAVTAGPSPGSVFRAEASGADRQRASLPVDAPLVPLLPGGGLRPGSVVAVRGSAALLLALLAAATRQGSWAAVVGVPDLGVVAAAEAGVALQRLALVPEPAEPGPVAAALLDGVGLLALAAPERLTAGARRSLAGRARQRESVLLPLGHWPGADVELDCHTRDWHGPEAGHGRLRSREVLVRATGRGAAARPRATRLLLPGPGGPVAETVSPVAPIRVAS